MVTPAGEEVRFDVDGRVVAGVRYGRRGGLPVLALHGWLDNAASFARVLPALDGLDAVALDLPGHGHSDHRPPPGSYDIWDDLLEILAVADELDFDRFVLVGHSRGAAVATLLAASEPERVAGLVLLDGAVPQPVDTADAPAQLHQYLADQRRATRKRLPRYRNFAAAVAARRRVMPMPLDAAELVVERGLAGNETDGYHWRSDPRLTLASSFKLTEAHNRAFVDALACPTLVLLAEGGLGGHEAAVGRLRQYDRWAIEILPGCHHFHAAAATAAAVAQRVARFLARIEGQKGKGGRE